MAIKHYTQSCNILFAALPISHIYTYCLFHGPKVKVKPTLVRFNKANTLDSTRIT